MSQIMLKKMLRKPRIILELERHSRRQFSHGREESQTLSEYVYRNVEVNHTLRSSRRTGLYGFHILDTPKGFRKFVQDAIEKSEGLIAHIEMMPSSSETIKAMDDISNTICMVVDSAEFCRNTHPDRDFVEESKIASMKIYAYLHYLNTNHVLYNAVIKTEKSGLLKTDESGRACQALRYDFEKGGIHLCKEKLERVNQLNLSITELGRQFGENIIKFPGQLDVFPASRIPKGLQRRLLKIKRTMCNKSMSSKSRGHATETGIRIMTEPGILSSILKWVPDEEIRKQAYIVGHSVSKENLKVLDHLISSRHELAQILGYDSYADFCLTPTMASSPGTVMSFLDDLSSAIKMKADKEMQLLRNLKKATGRDDSGLEPWDETYYIGLLRDSSCNLESSVIASYFPLSQCIEGLKLVVESLFGATFENVPLAPGESWHPDVQKLVLHHPSEGDLGCMYLDLYARDGKYPGCANFAIKGGKRMSESIYQLPVVALVCNFFSPGASRDVLLSHCELETLFHEFGHALHSLLSQTEYQHFSGTRTVLDFAETPSNLFEYFACDHRVLKLFGKHHLTGEEIPEKLVKSIDDSKRMFAATELQNQIFYSVVDQAFFGKQSLSPIDTVSVFAELKEKYTSSKYVEGTHWFTRFNHLVNYGAGYYSYLYAKCFAASIWRKACSENPLSLETGSILRHGFFKYGGSKDPSSLLRNCLGESAVNMCSGGGIKPNTADIFEEMNL